VAISPLALKCESYKVTTPLQPFGFTGYQMDEAGGLYFAQARRYDAANGRFVSKDSDRYIRFSRPDSLNQYMYCYDSPLKYLDPSGNDCYYFYLPEWKDEAENDRKQIADYYGIDESQVHLVPIENNQDLQYAWDQMGVGGPDGLYGPNKEEIKDPNIDLVVINTHASGQYEWLSYGDYSDDTFTSNEVNQLVNKDVDLLILYGCNAGHYDHVGTNSASQFCNVINGGYVLAADGTVSSGLTFFNINDRKYHAVFHAGFLRALVYGYRHTLGWMLYQEQNGVVEVLDYYGHELTVTQMLDKIEVTMSRLGILDLINSTQTNCGN